MSVVLDTCAVLWLTLNPSELSGKAHKLIASADRLIVSSISIWEIGVKATRQRIELGTTLDDYVERLSKSDGIEIVPVDHLLWTKSVLLKWDHRDPADRVIVSQAQQLEAVLITDDKELKKFYRRCVA